MQNLRLMVAGGAVVIVAVVAAVVFGTSQDPRDGAVSDAGPAAPAAGVDPAPAATQTATVDDPDTPTADPVLPTEDMAEIADPIADAMTNPVSVEDSAEDVAQMTPHLPVVTDRRFETDGAFLVSGRAAAGLPLAVIVDGDEIERVDVAPDGSFIVIGFLGFSDTPRSMDLISDPDGAGLRADRTFLLAANPAPVVVAATDPVQDTPGVAPVEEAISDPTADGTPDAPATVAQPATDGTAQAPSATDTGVATATSDTPASPAVLAVTVDGVEVVQPAIAADTSPQVMSNVALDTITYSPAGDVVLGGRALGQGVVQVYVDNTPVSRLPVEEDGTWRGDLPDVDTGVYTLRIDELDADGTVLSRIETPFQREDRADVIDAMADQVANPDFTVATRTVQPGATLWAIARERYGSGVLYVSVFEANKDRIRDPDLIYPGQVFVLPESSN